MLRFTRTGTMLRAYAQDAQGAALCGIDQERVLRLTFGLGGALAGIAAFCFVLAYSRPFGQHGAESGLTAFTAAVLGGVGNPIGALLSGLVLGILGSFSDYLLPAQWTPVLVLGVLVLLLVLRPSGLLLSHADNEEATQDVLMYPSGQQHGARLLWLVMLACIGYLLLDSMLGWHSSATMVQVIIFMVLALGLNVLLGFAGVLDLGFAAYFAIGGFVAALLLGGNGVPQPREFLLVLLAAAGCAALVGVANGFLMLRLRGDALAIVSLAIGQIVPRALVNRSDLTGGVGGIAALPAPQLLGISLDAMEWRFVLAGVLLIVSVLICARLALSRVGRGWAALREDAVAAAGVGVAVRQLRPLAFGIAAALAGGAAALSASAFSYVAPGQGDLQLSIMLLAMVVIGGLGSVAGALQGAAAVALYNQLLYPALSGWWAEQAILTPWMRAIDLRSLSYLAFGLMLYLAVRWKGKRGSVEF